MPEHVAWVRLAVQQLLGGAAVDDRSTQTFQRVAQKLPVRVGERRGVVAAPNQLLSLATRSVKCGVATSICRMPACSRSSACA